MKSIFECVSQMSLMRRRLGRARTWCMTRERPPSTATPISTLSSSWDPSTSWWPSPTGSSKHHSELKQYRVEGGEDPLNSKKACTVGVERYEICPTQRTLPKLVSCSAFTGCFPKWASGSVSRVWLRRRQFVRLSGSFWDTKESLTTIINSWYFYIFILSMMMMG